MCEYRWIKFSCHTTHASRLGEIWSSACDAPVAGPKPPGRVAALCRDKMFRHPILTLETQKCYACFIEEFPHMKEWQWRVNIIVALDIADGHVGGNAWVRWIPCDEEYWEGFLYNDERGMASAA